MTISTVDALAVSTRAAPARDVSLAPARPADAAPRATHGSQQEAAVRDEPHESQEDGDEALDTGALVARFFDVLQAAAAAGTAAGRPGNARQADDPADGESAGADMSTDTALSVAGEIGGLPTPFNGPAMAMPLARSWGLGDGSQPDGASAAGTAVPLTRGSPAGAVESSTHASMAAPTAGDATSASARPGGAASAAALTTASGTAGAWPLFGPPAARVSARGTDDASQSATGASDAGDTTAASTSSMASSRARLESSLPKAESTGSAIDRLRPTTVGAADAATAAGPGATPGGGVSALWPWPSAGGSGAPSTATVTLPAGSPADWRDALSQALGDRLQLTLKQGGDQAVIRLDPPLLGRIDLSIRQDGAALSVHLSASNPDVLRQLQAMGDGLRQDLAGRHVGDLTVTVAHQPSGTNADADARQRNARHDDDAAPAAPGRALAEADSNADDDGESSADPRHAARNRAAFASLTRSGGAA